jgi:hypothetical protein
MATSASRAELVALVQSAVKYPHKRLESSAETQRRVKFMSPHNARDRIGGTVLSVLLDQQFGFSFSKYLR